VVYVGDEIGHYRGIGSVGFGATQIFQGLVVFAVRILHIAGVVTCPWRVRTVLSLDKIELFKGFIEFFLVEQAVSPGKPTLILLVGCECRKLYFPEILGSLRIALLIIKEDGHVVIGGRSPGTRRITFDEIGDEFFSVLMTQAQS